MTQTEIKTLAQEAIDAAARHIQDKLDAPSGDIAGLFFIGETLDITTQIFADYIRQEICFRTNTTR